MKIALAQINPTIGDLAGNVARCLAAIETAQRQEAELVVLPEMAIPGYPPRDILFDLSFSQAVLAAARDLAEQTAAGPPIIVGSFMPTDRQTPGHPGLYNAALLLSGGRVQLAAAKRLLPTYDVFFEPRWFMPGPALPPLTLAGRHVGLLVCEDLWDEGYEVHPPAELLTAGAELLICIAASPYRHNILAQRLHHARRQNCSMIYVNLCGGNDELIFDGRSFALNGVGEIVAQLAGFEEQVRVVDLEFNAPAVDGLGHADFSPLSPLAGGTLKESASSLQRKAANSKFGERGGQTPAVFIEELYQALVLGIRDFVGKNRLERAFLGVSGGIDSAVVAAIAAEALGPGRVTAVAIPSRYTDPRSTACAQALAEGLDIAFETVALEPLHKVAETTLGDDLLGQGTTAENIQARLRAVILMSFVNRYGGLLLNTSNKTELSLGYATLYGDMAGTLCPIADLTKPQVVALARWINTERAIIPPFILDRPPSAELRPAQVDPFDYATVAPTLEKVVQATRSNPALRRSEHKRWQMGVVLKVSEKAFGTGRMMPISRR